MTERIKKLCENLRKNNMEALYFEDSAAARDYLKRTLKKNAVITVGGSMTLNETGIRDLIACGDYNFMDRSKEGITPEELLLTYKATVGGDYYFCSANALTEQGEIVNVDGIGNRVAANAFGSDKVYMIVGVNKIVKDLTEAFLRIKRTAAPKNSRRLGYDTPCAKTGICVSLMKGEDPAMTDGCDAPERICRDYLIMTRQKIKDRICVIIINEELGY